MGATWPARTELVLFIRHRCIWSLLSEPVKDLNGTWHEATGTVKGNWSKKSPRRLQGLRWLKGLRLPKGLRRLKV